jgi:glycosyltransferase involved in cell wall biosynthesis
MKISVLTPSFNAAPHLERAIASVVTQDYADWEHVVADGGSTDGTIEILQKHRHLQWLSEPDRGQSDAMNKAFSRSTGDVIVYLNADDHFEAGAFRQVAACFAAGDADLVVGKLRVTMPERKHTYVQDPPTQLEEILDPRGRGFPANPTAYFYRHQVQDSVGPFPVQEHYAMDYWFLLRAYQAFRVRKIDAVLGHFFLSEKSKSAHPVDATLAQFNVLADFLEENPQYPARECLSRFVATLLREQANTRRELELYQQKFRRFAHSPAWRLVRRFFPKPPDRAE